MRGGLKIKQISFFLMISFSLLSLHSFASAQGNSPPAPSGGAIVADILLFRPLAFLGIFAGTVGVVISSLVTIPFNQTHEAAEILIMQPYRYTFERPLGKMSLPGENSPLCGQISCRLLREKAPRKLLSSID